MKNSKRKVSRAKKAQQKAESIREQIKFVEGKQLEGVSGALEDIQNFCQANSTDVHIDAISGLTFAADSLMDSAKLLHELAEMV